MKRVHNRYVPDDHFHLLASWAIWCARNRAKRERDDGHTTPDHGHIWVPHDRRATDIPPRVTEGHHDHHDTIGETP